MGCRWDKAKHFVDEVRADDFERVLISADAVLSNHERHR
jgi:hypothetical protein